MNYKQDIDVHYTITYETSGRYLYPADEHSY